MKRVGRKPVKFPGKTDVHPPKGYVNFWDRDMAPKNPKARDRRQSAQDISQDSC